MRYLNIYCDIKYVSTCKSYVHTNINNVVYDFYCTVLNPYNIFSIRHQPVKVFKSKLLKFSSVI